MLKAGSVMEWKGCHFENRRLALGVVFCRANPLGVLPVVLLDGIIIYGGLIDKIEFSTPELS